MNVKPEAKIDNLHPMLAAALPTIERVFKDYDSYCTLTSGHEGSPTDLDRVHKATSKHYIVNNKSGKGEACDFRGKHLNYKTLQDIEDRLKKVLGPAFDVVLEITDKMGNLRNHIHIEIH